MSGLRWPLAALLSWLLAWAGFAGPLQANTTYYLFVRAWSQMNVPTAYQALGVTSTDASNYTVVATGTTSANTPSGRSASRYGR